MFFKNTSLGLHQNQEERLDHLKAYKKLRDSGNCELFDFLYDNLNIVDSKTAALLQFNGISLAIITIVFTLVHSIILKGFLIGVLLLATISSLISLKGIYLHWAGTNDFLDPDHYFEQLLQVRDERTLAYRRAWLLSVWSIALFCIAIIGNYIILAFHAF